MKFEPSVCLYEQPAVASFVRLTRRGSDRSWPETRLEVFKGLFTLL